MKRGGREGWWGWWGVGGTSLSARRLLPPLMLDSRRAPSALRHALVSLALSSVRHTILLPLCGLVPG